MSTGLGPKINIIFTLQHMPMRHKYYHCLRGTGRGDPSSLRPPEQGFTLIELLLVLALMSVISIMVMNIFLTNIRLFREGSDRVALDEEARGIFRRLTHDIESLFIPPTSPALSPPLRGKNSTFHSTAEDSRAVDTLRFAAIVSSSLPAPGDGGLGEVKWIEYALAISPGDKTGVLLRKLSSLPEGVETGEKHLPLSTHVRELNFRYLNQQQWNEEWNRHTLPDGVEIFLTLQESGWQSTSRSYRTFVSIPLRQQ